jgi:hypothetical protein
MVASQRTFTFVALVVLRTNNTGPTAVWKSIASADMKELCVHDAMSPQGILLSN